MIPLRFTKVIFKPKHRLNPSFARDAFCASHHNYNARNQIFLYPNPQNVMYGIEGFECKAMQVWNSIPNEIRTSSNLSLFKTNLARRFMPVPTIYANAG